MDSPGESFSGRVLQQRHVGLPLAVEFGRRYPTVGFDISEGRISELQQGHDRTGEVDDFSSSPHLSFSSDLEKIRDCNVYIVAVPTPVDSDMRPDLTPLIRASETVGKVIDPNDIVIYESTVYPGATEEDCIPVVEKTSAPPSAAHRPRCVGLAARRRQLQPRVRPSARWIPCICVPNAPT